MGCRRPQVQVLLSRPTKNIAKQAMFLVDKRAVFGTMGESSQKDGPSDWASRVSLVKANGGRFMRYLGLVRHASYDERTGRINPAGVADMQKLADRFEPTARECRRTRSGIDVISSSSFRALDSAMMLAGGLGLEHVRSFRQLYSDRETLVLQAALAILKRIGDEIPKGLLVAVTHDEIAHDLPPLLLAELGVLMQPKSLKRGEACIIDLADKKVRFITA